MSFQPIVKWSGSKRSQAEQIVSRMPREISTYYEPFCGGCSVLRQLLDTPEIHVGHYVASDLNGDLISLWNKIKEDPDFLCAEYERMWHEMNDGNESNLGAKRDYYFSVRDQFNKDRDSAKFLFIMRTTENGMPRYNSKGEFNNAFHLTRSGMEPNRLSKICREWHTILKEHDVEFKESSYDFVSGDDNSLTYLDPPYFNTKGMYYGTIDYGKYLSWLQNLNGKWIMSFDGKVNGEIYGEKAELPSDLYVTKEFIKSGNSSFRRVIAGNPNSVVEEALYKNY